MSTDDANEKQGSADKLLLVATWGAVAIGLLAFAVVLGLIFFGNEPESVVESDRVATTNEVDTPDPAPKPLQPASAKTTVEDASPVAKIKSMGGHVFRDHSVPDKPVIRVLFNIWTTNAALGPLRELPRLRIVSLSRCGALTNVDGLQGLTGLQELDLRDCDALTNVDGLRGCIGLQKLDLSDCDVLTNVDGLKGATRLQKLNLWSCDALTNVDGLRGCTALRDLRLDHCDALTNVDGLQGLTGLQTLDLDGCDALANIDGLQGCTGLQKLELSKCDAVSQADRDKLRASLPETGIKF